jgi:hypothetical protein
VYARSTTVQARSDAIDAGIAHIRDEVLPALRGLAGSAGMSLLVDRASCRCIATSSWETEDAMRDSAQDVGPLRQRAVELLGGGQPQVDEWEIAVLHRDHHSREGACVRCTWVTFSPDEAERAIDAFKTTALPEAEKWDGFCSASLMLDRSAGRGVASITYDSKEAIEGTRQQADQLRAATADQGGLQVTEVAEFELAIAHLHVPETV